MLKSIALFVIVTLAIAVPLVAHFGFRLQGGRMKAAIGLNLFSFFGPCWPLGSAWSPGRPTSLLRAQMPLPALRKE